MAENIEYTGKITPDYGYHCDLESVSSDLKDIPFPISKQDLLAQYGDERLPCSGGDQHTLKELLEPLSKEQYNSITDIEDAMAHPVKLAHLA